MRLAITLVALMLVASPAWAQTIGSNNVGSGNGNGNLNGNNNGNVSFSARGNTPSFAAPGLSAAGIESCLASVSAGGAGGGIAVTIAGPILDKGCDIRLFSRTLYAMGHRQAATQILCNDPQAAQALAVEGVRCYVGIGAQMQNPGPPQPQLFGGIFGCKHYVLFQGCLDEPAPAVAAVEPPQEVAETPHRHRLKKVAAQSDSEN